jgi:hypothetical protein
VGPHELSETVILNKYYGDKIKDDAMTGARSIFFSLWLYSPLNSGRFFNFLILYTVGRIPWTGDQPIAMPLPTHRTTQTQNKRTQISIIE